ncbi:MAG: ThiF family adenylyltransferase [Prevotella sp.]|jgi:molybdopterin/thiamine biosynthesis adenylyltransferase|nr:ThiF family adenylyltransferase [Prevotella sp.]
MDYTIYVVGCGGTGSLLARDIPKLLVGSKDELVLIDGDMVEKKNIIRQSYQQQDIGDYKSIALSRKINSLYGPVSTAVDTYLTKDELFTIIKHNDTIPIIIGCVDNDSTRKLLENTFKRLKDAVYIDSANSEYDGNVYVSIRLNGKKIGKLRSEVYRLKKDNKPTDKSCEQQAADGNIQYLVTNVKMACTILEHLSNILDRSEKDLVGVTKVDRFEEVFVSQGNR